MRTIHVAAISAFLAGLAASLANIPTWHAVLTTAGIAGILLQLSAFVTALFAQPISGAAPPSVSPKNLSLIVLAVALSGVGVGVSSCASFTPRQTVINGVDVATKSLQAAADAEHTLCDPSVPMAQPVLTCTATAHALLLTDAAHQTISGALAKAATGLGTYATSLESGATTADPSQVDTPLQNALTTIQAIPGVGGTVASAILALASDVQQAQADFAKLKAQFSPAAAPATTGS